MAEHPKLQPATVAPYFIVVALIHLAAVATLNNDVAAKLPADLPTAVMLVQFPLILLSGFFEGRLEYGKTLDSLPLWMRIDSKPVKLAFTLGFMYIAIVVLKTLHVSIGPIDPNPPATFPLQTRLMWFAIFSVGMFFPFYLAATGLLIPVLRTLTKPLRSLPTLAGGTVALVVGGGAGVAIFALATKTGFTAFVDKIHATINDNPALAIGITFGMTLGPMVLGWILGKKEE